MAIELPESVEPLFRAAGWHRGRQVSISRSVPTNHPALAILATVGGLTVTPDRKVGEECAPNDLAFQELEPNRSISEVWNALLDTILVGVAEMHDGHAELYVAADGRCFGCSLVHDAFYFEGNSFGEAAERSLFGRRSQPMLRPNQPSVTLYGIEYSADSPELYRYT